MCSRPSRRWLAAARTVRSGSGREPSDPIGGQGSGAAHVGSMLLVQLSSRQVLVSWDTDGSIRFWTKSGGTRWKARARPRRRTGVVPRANTEQAIVSWDDAGSCLFWTKNGDPMEREGAAAAHSGSVIVDVGEAEGGIVRLGRCWFDPVLDEGQQPHQRKGAAAAHAGRTSVCGGGSRKCFSWGTDGSILFWTKAGEPISSARARPRGGGRVLGVLETEQALVSWGNDGSNLGSGPRRVSRWRARARPMRMWAGGADCRPSRRWSVGAITGRYGSGPKPVIFSKAKVRPHRPRGARS